MRLTPSASPRTSPRTRVRLLPFHNDIATVNAAGDAGMLLNSAGNLEFTWRSLVLPFGRAIAKLEAWRS